MIIISKFDSEITQAHCQAELAAPGPARAGGGRGAELELACHAGRLGEFTVTGTGRLSSSSCFRVHNLNLDHDGSDFNLKFKLIQRDSEVASHGEPARGLGRARRRAWPGVGRRRHCK
jgi:hypothetical protein